MLAIERFSIPADAEHQFHAWIIPPDCETFFACILMVHGSYSDKTACSHSPEDPGKKKVSDGPRC